MRSVGEAPQNKNMKKGRGIQYNGGLLSNGSAHSGPHHAKRLPWGLDFGLRPQAIRDEDMFPPIARKPDSKIRLGTPRGVRH